MPESSSVFNVIIERDWAEHKVASLCASKQRFPSVIFSFFFIVTFGAKFYFGNLGSRVILSVWFQSIGDCVRGSVRKKEGGGKSYRECKL